MATIEDMKQEISDLYIKNFKKDQTWVRRLMILPIQPKIKDIISGKKDLPKTFDEIEEFWWWKGVMKFMSLDLANDLFDFMKEKRLEIERNNTMEELIALKQEILWEKSNESENEDENEAENNNWENENPPVDAEGPEEQWNDNHDNTPSENGTPTTNGENENNEPNGMRAWAITAWSWALATLAFSEGTKKLDQVIVNESLDAKKITESINSAIAYAEKQKSCMWLSEKQIKTVNKHISKLKEWLADVGEDGLEALRLRNKFGDKIWESRAKILANWWIPEKTLNAIEKRLGNLADNAGPEEIESVLKAIENEKNINIDPDIYKIFKQAENASEAKCITKILRHGSKFNRIAQTLVGALWLDVAFLWIDVWVYFETKKEAELISKINEARWQNKYNQAYFQLWVWISSILLEALWVIIVYTATWSYGWWIGALIWLWVWILTAAGSICWDAYYYDVNDFYLQNKEDYIRKERSELKQAILQWIHNKKEWNTSTNEKVHAYVHWASGWELAYCVLNPAHFALWVCCDSKDDSELKDQKSVSLWDACRAMMFLEEISEWWVCAYDNLMYRWISSWKKVEEFKGTLSVEEHASFDESMRLINERIEKRMEFINKEFEKPDVINAINWYCWMQYLTELFNNSSIYAQACEEWTRDENCDFEENKNKYKELIFKDFDKDKLEKLEKLRQDNPTLFFEIIETTTLNKCLEIKDEWDNHTNTWYEKNDDYFDEYDFEDDSHYDEMIEEYPSYEHNVKLVLAYKKWLWLTENVEQKHLFPVSLNNTIFVTNILKNDFEVDWIDYHLMSKEMVVDNISIWWRYEDLNISDDVMTNILYRLARELYWYNWNNNEYDIIQYFSEWTKNAHWLYFDGWRRINVDWWHDCSMDKLDNKLQIKESDVDKYVNDFMDQFGSKCIDTATESIDDKLTKEFKDKLRSIVKEELSYHTVENQQKIKDDITEFVKKYTENTDEYYIFLPYYLVVEAKRAGLWDFQSNYFRYKDGHLEICYAKWQLNHKSVFDDCDKSYVTNARETYTEEEQYYIDRVDSACKEIEALRSLEWFDLRALFDSTYAKEDDLDLPVELERIISAKENERRDFKENVLLFDETKASSNEVLGKYIEYAEYFESMYRWMLILISWFTWSNDIDDIKYFAQAMAYWSRNIFDEKWNLLEIKKDVNDRNKLAQQKDFIDFYNKQIENLKIWDNTIKELWNSEKLEEKDLARQASYIIYTTVLENALVAKDENGNVTSINPWLWFYNNDTRKTKKSKIEETIREKISKLKVVELNSEKIKTLIDSNPEKQTLKPLTKEEKKTTDTTPEIQELIISTANNIDRAWKRWHIKYDPEKKVITSRNNETSVDRIYEKEWSFNGKTYKSVEMELYWLDLDLSLEEWIWLANFKNRLKDTYWYKTVEHAYWFKSGWYYTFYVGNTKIINRSSLEKFCPACKDHDTRKKIASWLNWYR